MQETVLPTEQYNSMDELYGHKETNGEIASCSLSAINITEIEDDEEYYKTMYYALLMIDQCIHMSDYPLPHLELTAKARLSAGVGILNLAYHMAKKHLSYTTLEGLEEIHKVAERHMYMGIKASLQLGKELGNAPWIGKTKWVDGWLPIDTYNKNVDNIVKGTLLYDWEGLREEIRVNKGIRNSVCIAIMPAESSSKSIGTCNSVYPIRSLDIIKGDGDNITYWSAPESERLSKWYDIAWDVAPRDMINVYAILQKFVDQGISADIFKDVSDGKVSSSEMIRNYLHMVKMGLKTRYYLNTKTTSNKREDDAVGCESGACSL